MTLEEIWNRIDNSDPSEWESQETGDGVIETFLKGDVNLRFVNDIDYGKQDHFNEDWATHYPDSQAWKYDLRIYYNATCIAVIPVVCIDGGRATLPFPDHETREIPYRTYKAAKVGIPDNSRLDEYISRSHLSVASRESDLTVFSI